MRYGLPLFLLALVAARGDAAGTATWEMGSYQDFLRGQFTGVSLSREGRLTLAPKTETLFSSDQPVIWSVAQAPDGTLYAGTGHRGRVFKIDRSGKSEVFWAADQPEVFAIALDPKGALYAASSPKGKIYRIESGKAVEFFSPGSVYIWSLVFAKDGTLFVGTGDEGKVFRVDHSGKGEIYYETGQTHVTSLALDAQGRLLAGTEPNGILYRIEAKDKAFVLYDADLPEIRAITAAPDGVIYAAAQGGASTRRGIMATQTPPGVMGKPVVSATTTSITVTDDAQGGVEIKPKPEAAKPASAATPQVTTQFSPIVDISGIEKSALYRILPDNTVETLWSSKDENVYDILPSGGQIVFATDGKGRIYRLGADRKVTLLVQTNESEATRLVQGAGGLLAATGNLGKIFRLGDALESSGVYEAPVHDAGTVARWGKLNWRAETTGGSRVTFRTRSGNSARPDKTWSDWSDPLSDSAGSQVSSPNARYLQWKAEFTGGGGPPPVLDNVTAAYLPQNTPPTVKSISVTVQASGAGAAAKPAAAQAPGASYSITVTDTGEAGPATSAGTPTQTLGRAAARQIQITWQAEDLDGDRLVYALHFRGEDEREWKLVKADLQENTITLDGDVLADGRYFFRVTASDQLSNPRSSAREAELVSAPVLIDNTPPRVTAGEPKREGSRVEIDIEAVDAASALRRAEYSVDAGRWTPLEAADGIIDSASERFVLRLENVSPGEHLIVVRVYDAADNAGLTKVVLR
jgi:sugar lactone lactonase YvrE